MGTYAVFFIFENFWGTSQRVLWKIYPLETFDFKVTAQNLKLVSAYWAILESFMNLYRVVPNRSDPFGSGFAHIRVTRLV